MQKKDVHDCVSLKDLTKVPPCRFLFPFYLRKMLQGTGYDKEALVEMLREQKRNPAPVELERVPVAAPKAPSKFTSNDVPASPYQRLLSCIESKNDMSILSMMEEIGNDMSRLKQVSEDFIRGTMGLFHLPCRDNTVKYQTALTNCLRQLFAAYASKLDGLRWLKRAKMTDSRLPWAVNIAVVHPTLFLRLKTIANKLL